MHLNASKIDDTQTIHSIDSIYHPETAWSWYSRGKKIIEKNIISYLNEESPSIFTFFLLFFFEINRQHDTTRNDMTIVYCWRLSGKQDEFMVKISKTENYTRSNKNWKKKNEIISITMSALPVHCTLRLRKSMLEYWTGYSLMTVSRIWMMHKNLNI